LCSPRRLRFPSIIARCTAVLMSVRLRLLQRRLPLGARARASRNGSLRRCSRVAAFWIVPER
jgi:hypothetical protein